MPIIDIIIRMDIGNIFATPESLLLSTIMLKRVFRMSLIDSWLINRLID